MRARNSVLLYLTVAAVCAAVLQVAERPPAGGQPARWFVPGPLGSEAGRGRAGGGGQTTEGGPQTTEHTRAARSSGVGRSSSGFETRAFSGLRTAEERAWGRNNGLTPSVAFSHNLTRVFPPELYKKKPELFPWVDGKRLEPPKGSYFWNPDIARKDAAVHAANVARQHFAAHPADVSFALGVNDALIWGESDELLALLRGAAEARTARQPENPRPSEHPAIRSSEAGLPMKWFRGRPDYSKVVFTFMNRAAAELSRTHPEKYLGALAYYWCENVPGFALHPQVVPFLTTDRSQGYDADFRQEEFELQERWGGLAAEGRMTGRPDDQPGSGSRRHDGARTVDESPDHPASRPSGHLPRRLGMYDYLYGGGFIIPRIHTRLIAGNLRHARRVGFTDYYAEVNPNWGLDGPMPWLTAQLLQNPERAVASLLEEYYHRYFREAAEPMRRFFEKCEEQWMAQPGPPYWLKHYRNESQATVFPPHVRGALRLMLTEAETLARSRKVQERVRLVSAAFGVTERFLDFQDERVSLARAAAGVDAAGVTMAAALTDYLDARREFIRSLLHLRHEQPLALYPVNYDDFLRNNPGFAATVRVLDGAAGIPRSAEWLRRRPEAWIQAAVEYHAAKSAGRLRELLPAGSLEGARAPGRKIAGLAYGIDLPAPWRSQLEPTQSHEGVVTPAAAHAGAAGLRLSGAVNSTVYQWIPITGGRTFVASVYARARVSPGDAVTLTLGWLDAQQRHVGAVVVARIPDGDWPDWIQLRQGAPAPANAAWAGIGVRVQNQVAGDWVEFDDFSLVEVIDP